MPPPSSSLQPQREKEREETATDPESCKEPTAIQSTGRDNTFHSFHRDVDDDDDDDDDDDEMGFRVKPSMCSVRSYGNLSSHYFRINSMQVERITKKREIQSNQV